MDGPDCTEKKFVSGAVVYSHSPASGPYYPHDIDCAITFQAESADWKLMLRVIEMDLPDRTASGFCNDALYVYDAGTFLTRAMGVSSTLWCVFDVMECLGRYGACMTLCCVFDVRVCLRRYGVSSTLRCLRRYGVSRTLWCVFDVLECFRRYGVSSTLGCVFDVMEYLGPYGVSWTLWSVFDVMISLRRYGVIRGEYGDRTTPLQPYIIV
ncbi:hypothetical protein Btru_062440 [Bulinus truncatus]|nr:hypothetical protein Btru_062440 [Bulinus truncatus]